jgi:hypothetical protein
MPRMLLALLLLAGCALGPPRERDLLAEGVALRNQGQIRLSIDTLTLARGQAASERARAIAGGELGASLLAARRLDDARRELEGAAESLDGADRARYLLDLGSLELIERKPEAARARFEQARALAGADVIARVAAEVQLVRVLDGAERVVLIESASRALEGAGTAVPGRLHLALGSRALEQGSLTLEIADRHLAAARNVALAASDTALTLEADDALSQRYEDADRLGDSRDPVPPVSRTCSCSGGRGVLRHAPSVPSLRSPHTFAPSRRWRRCAPTSRSSTRTANPPSARRSRRSTSVSPTCCSSGLRPNPGPTRKRP